MASIIKASIDLNKIPKDKIYVGKKGKYLPIPVTLNDEYGHLRNQGPVVVAQSKDLREAKSPKAYLGIVTVAWTNGNNVDTAPRPDTQGAPAPNLAPQADDLPF